MGRRRGRGEKGDVEEGGKRGGDREEGDLGRGGGYGKGRERRVMYMCQCVDNGYNWRSMRKLSGRYWYVATSCMYAHNIPGTTSVGEELELHPQIGHNLAIFEIHTISM